MNDNSIKIDNDHGAAGDTEVVGDIEDFGITEIVEDIKVAREDIIAAAQGWLDSGLNVTLLLSGTAQAAVSVKPEVYDQTYESIVSDLDKHPDSDLGFQVGESLIVFRAKTKRSQASFNRLKESLGVSASTIMASTEGVEFHFWLSKGTNVAFATKRNQGHPDAIELLTGKAIVSLPPTGGKVAVVQASNTGDYMSVGQAFVDAIGQYNDGLSDALENGDDDAGDAEDDADPPVGAPAPASALVSLAAPGKSGETGETGALPSPVASGTAFTAFVGPDARETSSVVPIPTVDADPIIFPVAPEKSGETGVLSVVGATAGSTVFMGLQAACLVAVQPAASDTPAVSYSDAADAVLTPRAAENPVVAALKERGLYKTPMGSGLHELTCPWVHEHDQGSDTRATYSEPDDLNAIGVFCCTFAHAEKHTTQALLEQLGVPNQDARNKPVIRVVDGDLHRVVDAAEMELANHGNHFQYGGLIASVRTDPSTGDPSIVPTSVSALTRALSVAASFEKYRGTSKGWVPCDPPMRHVGVLFNAQTYAHLPTLVGVARQPYFRETDGELVTQPGYDKVSKRFGVFDPRQFVIPPFPTKETALAARAMLEELLCEFRFAQDYDKSAALSAMLTASVRPSLPYAPAFHARAAVSSSGKTYLCDLISAFASPAPSAKVSYPSSSDEATKAMLALLITNPAVVEFDDLATDWLPHGIINRMLTSEYISDRILGVSKVATVGTRALFLGSGNNVGPLRDLLRRVVTANLDSRCATPATITYKHNPVAMVRKHRGAYVAAALTIILAWKAAGSPRADVPSIATYNGAWSDYCRHPLIWLGLPDPATSLLEQVTHDLDSDALGALLLAWYQVFASNPTTVRKLIASLGFGHEDLKDAIHDFPVLERGEVNPGKLGWILRKNANRIVCGLKFVEAFADGRKAWAAVVADPAALALALAATAKTSLQHSTAKPATELDDSDRY